MSKKDIGKILTTGSTKQRLLLLAEDKARANFGKEGKLLTDHEVPHVALSSLLPVQREL